ncbi:MAG: Calx-beta domain-containing protein [Caldilineaceae bacterium]
MTVTLQSIPTATVTVMITPDGQLDLGAGSTPISLTFAADSSALTPQTFTVNAVDDAVVEAALHNGTLSFAVSSSDAQYHDLSLSDRTLSVQDNDRAQLTISDATTLEGDSGPTTVRLTVTLDSAVDLPFTVDYTTVDNSAVTAAGDYAAATGSLAFTGLVSETAQLTVTIFGDTLIEANETLSTTLSNVTFARGARAVTIGDPSAQIAIRNDDTADVAFARPTSSTSEDDTIHSVSLLLTGTKAIALTQPVTAVIATTAAGTATNGAVDYSFTSPTTLTFPAGSVAGDLVTVTIPINNDALVEGDETIALTLTTVSDPLAIVQLDPTRASHDITLVDNDVAYTLAAAQSSVAEGDSGSTAISFTITRTGAVTTTGGTVDFVLAGTATAGVDYTNISPVAQQINFLPGATNAQFTLDIVGDFIDEIDEAITATLITPTVSATNGTALINGGSQSTIILDDDSAAIVVTGDSATPLSEGDTDRVFTVTLQSVPTATVTVTIFADDQLDLGAGAGVPISLTFAANSSALTPQTFTLFPVDDAVVEAASQNSTLIFAAVSSDNHYDSFPLNEIPLTVLDNDSAQLTIGDVTVNEGDSGSNTATLTVTLDNAVDLSFTVDYVTADSSATVTDNDYVAVSGTLAFAGMVGEVHTFTITVNGDSIVEVDELFTADLGNLAFGRGNRAVRIGDTQATVTILNDDRATVTLRGGGVQDEGDSGVTSHVFTATLDHAVTGGFIVAYQSNDGSATTSDSDYVAQSGTLTFGGLAGESHPIIVTSNGDTVVELDESFQMTLGTITSTLAAAIELTGTTQTATIRNDDSTAISITDATAAEDAGTMNFVLLLTNPSDAAVTVTYVTTNNTALADQDYTTTTGTATIPAGAQSTIVAVPIVDDILDELTETLTMQLSAPTPAATTTIVDDTAIGQILDNDAPSSVISVSDPVGTEGRAPCALSSPWIRPVGSILV